MRHCLTVAGLIVLCCSILRGGGLQDAKALLDQKKYDDVDGALAAELSQPAPVAEVLRLSLEANRLAGRIVTAEKRATTLLKGATAADPELLFTAAQLAEQIGDERLALSRYLAYARLANDKSDKLESALNFVLEREAYVEEFKKYVTVFGASERAWAMATRLMQRLLEVPDAERSLELAEYLMKQYPDPERVRWVHSVLTEAANAYLLGREPKDRWIRPMLLMAKAEPASWGHVDHMLRQGRAAMAPAERVAFAKGLASRAKLPLSGEILSEFYQARELPSEDERIDAGKVYLTLEPLHRDSSTPEYYEYFLRIIVESPQIFNVANKALVSAADLQAKHELLKQKMPNSQERHSHHLSHIVSNYMPDAPSRVPFYLNNLKVLNYTQLNELFTQKNYEGIDALLTQSLQGRPFITGLDTRLYLMPSFNAAKRKDLLLSAARDYMTSYVYSFNWQHIQSHVINSPALEVEEKLALLEEIAAKGGATPPMRELIKTLAEDKAEPNKWAENPRIVALKQAMDANRVGTDPAMRDAAAMAAAIPNLGQGNTGAPVPATTDIAQRFLGEYTGPIPGDSSRCENPQQFLAYNIAWWHLLNCWSNVEALTTAIELWMPRLGVGTIWESLMNRCRNHQMFAVNQKLAARFVEILQDQEIWSGMIYELWVVPMPVENPNWHFRPLYARYPEAALKHLNYNGDKAFANDKAALFDEAAKVFAAGPVKLTDPSFIQTLIHHFYHWSDTTRPVPPPITKSLWEQWLAHEQKNGTYDLYTETLCYAHHSRSGRADEAGAFLTAYFETIKQRSVRQQLDATTMLLRHFGLPREEGSERKAGMRMHTIFQVLAPLLRQLPRDQWPGLVLYGSICTEIASLAQSSADAAQKAEALVLAKFLGQMLVAGVQMEGPGSWTYGLTDLLIRDAAERDDWPAVASLLGVHVSAMGRDGNWEDIYRGSITPLAKLLEEKTRHELIFAFAGRAEKYRLSDVAAKQIAILKSKAATQIPNMIPVAPGDPSYDLHQAAHAFSVGNETRAWELTQPKLELLAKLWETFDPRYISWSIDQMRKQKMLKSALELAMNVLLREQDLEPEVASRISLTKGDIYRDMENYQAARIEYEALRNTTRYRGTDAGTRATYRLIDLLIVTKDYDNAEALLERLVDSEAIATQVEANFLLAKMAFQRGQHVAAKDFIRKIRDRGINHVEAALLEGELNLILPGGLQNTEVAVGNPRLATTVVPGKVLTLKLQDPNLSVARGGAAIPVIVTTSKGGDVEHLKLAPSSTNKNLFSGTIPTALGKAQAENVLLELCGEDTVSYVIDPEFQKANELDYPPKILEVKSDARLVASSGEILTEEEEERRALERKLRRAHALESRQLEISRDGRTVRPGSPIYVQITDFDRDATDEPDKISVSLKTSSGDLLENFALTETGSHTGIFRGAVPTGTPLPKASASDSEEGRAPAGVINSTQPGEWRSVGDGAKPKWFEVDTMSSHELISFTAEVPNLASVREFAVQGILAEDWEDLAVFPASSELIKGGVFIDFAPDQRGDQMIQIQRHVRVAYGGNYERPDPVFDRQETPFKGGDGWMCARVRAAFYLTENRSLELKFLQPPSPHGWQTAWLLIDGRPVMGGQLVEQTLAVTQRVDLTKGAHRMEILVRDHYHKSQVIIGYRKTDGTFEPLPTEWFSTEAHPELAEFLKPKGQLAIEGDTLNLTLEQARRMRKLRVLFKDFSTPSVAIKTITVKDAAGNTILPVKEDFTAAATNSTLEIAPGDTVLVTYQDEKRLRDDSPTATSTLNSSFHNGAVMLASETVTANQYHDHWLSYYPAKRCRIGDQLMIVVTDFDYDTTEQRDTVDVLVTTSSGEKLELKALETYPNHGEEHNRHSGQFYGVLKIGTQTGRDTIKVSPGDSVTVAYLDKENTDPGVAVERSHVVMEAGVTESAMMVYPTHVTLVEDTSPEAQAKKRRVRARDRKDVTVFKDLVVARHPDYRTDQTPATQPVAGEPLAVSVSAPLLFEVYCPRAALNSASVLHVTAVAESEIRAAAKENRQPNVLKVPTYLHGIEHLASVKGYPMQLHSHIRRDSRQMLDDGIFAGVVRLQIGKAGDPIDDLVVTAEKEFVTTQQREGEWGTFYYKVPTLLVSGSDIVHLRLEQQGGQTVETKVRLLSNGRLELLDSAYIAQNEAIHLGEKFYIRLSDPDHDVTDERDTVSVVVAASSGDRLELVLTETLTHSGVFSAALKPEFLGEKVDGKLPAPDPADQTFSVTFGDEVTFTYIDDLSLLSSAPVTVTAQGKVHYGSDGELALFTKLFKDPEIAVRTRFLMAEALFEMAKEHRKLNQTQIADEEIARGKYVLEEALRDYPDTSYAAQGEFLLANLAQELAKYQEAIGRYSQVISAWPDSEYAPSSQFKKALCLEKMNNYDAACEEYVRLTYVYPDSTLVADATIRLGNYYYKKQSYPIAGKIFFNFRERNPQHKLAAEALFLSAQCSYKQEEWNESVRLFQMVVDEYPDNKEVRAEAMYWLADSFSKSNQYVKAYQQFKKLSWDYPDSKWAKIARGRLTEEAYANMKDE